MKFFQHDSLLVFMKCGWWSQYWRQKLYQKQLRWKTILTTKYSGNKHVWQQTTLTTNSFDDKQFWQQTIMLTNNFGDRQFWRQTILLTNNYGDKQSPPFSSRQQLKVPLVIHLSLQQWRDCLHLLRQCVHCKQILFTSSRLKTSLSTGRL